jgi:hypothetical protein
MCGKGFVGVDVGDVPWSSGTGGEEVVSFYLEGLAEFDDAVVGAALRSGWRWSGDLTGFAVTAERCVDRGGGVVQGELACTVCLMRFVCCISTLCVSWFRRFPS